MHKHDSCNVCVKIKTTHGVGGGVVLWCGAVDVSIIMGDVFSGV